MSTGLILMWLTTGLLSIVIWLTIIGKIFYVKDINERMNRAMLAIWVFSTMLMASLVLTLHESILK
jgi:hypothetical protein